MDCFIRVRAPVAVRRFEGNFEGGWRSMQRTLVLIFQKNPLTPTVLGWILTEHAVLKPRFYPNPAGGCTLILKGENDLQVN